MTEEEILTAISKSGYLFESEIAKFLIDSGFFVESNVVFQDPLTNKNREIDLVAETYNDFSTSDIDRVSCKICYFFELKNNDFPLVLLTEMQFNPYTHEELFKELITVPTGIDYNFLGEFSNILNEGRLFTQYCSFARKKGDKEFMAFHPDELYSSLSKLCWYCEKRTNDANDIFEGTKFKYFRHWLNLPVLLINNELYELTVGKDQPTLEKVKYSRLLVNFHFDDTPISTVVYVVTKEYLKDWLLEMNEIEMGVRTKMKSSQGVEKTK